MTADRRTIAHFKFACFDVKLVSDINGYVATFRENPKPSGIIEKLVIPYEGHPNPARDAMDTFARMVENAFSRTSRSMFTESDPNI